MLLSIKTAWVHAARRLVSHNSAQHYSYLSPYCLIVVNLSTIVASLILTFFGHIHLKWEKEQLIASPWNLCVFEICAEKIGRNFGAVCKFKMGETIRSFTIRTYHMVVKGGGGGLRSLFMVWLLAWLDFHRIHWNCRVSSGSMDPIRLLFNPSPLKESQIIVYSFILLLDFR